MEDFAELERRFSKAFERIHSGLGVLSEKAGRQTDAAHVAQVSALRAELEAEKGASAELRDRLRGLEADHAGKVDALEAKLAEARGNMTALDTELQRLRQATDELLETSEALRAAQEEGITEPHLINQALLAELDALNAIRKGELVEIEAVLSELRPLAEEAT